MSVFNATGTERLTSCAFYHANGMSSYYRFSIRHLGFENLSDFSLGVLLNLFYVNFTENGRELRRQASRYHIWSTCRKENDNFHR